MAERTRQYIVVHYTYEGKARFQRFTLSETRLINTVLKELADDNSCEVQLIECDQKTYKIYFG